MIQTLIKFALSYSIIDGFQKGLLLLATPLITAYLGSFEYGILALSLSIISLINILFNAGLTSAFSKYFFENKNEHDKLEFISKTICTQFLVIIFIAFLIIICTCIIFLFSNSNFLFVENIIVLVFISVFETGLLVFFNFFKVTRKLKTFSIWFNLFFISKVLIILWFCLHYSTAISYLQAQLIVSVIFFSILFLLFYKKYGLNFSFNHSKRMLSYSFPIIPVDLISVGNRFIDRWFISILLSIELSGVYYIGIQFGGITTLIAMGINAAYIPLFFKEFNESQHYKNIYKMAQSCILIMTIIGLIVALFMGDLIKLLFNHNYHGAIELIPILAFNGSILMIYFINTNILNLEKKLVKYKTYGVLSALMINIPLNYMLINKLGIIGASISTLVSYTISTMILGSIVKNKTMFQFNNIRIIIMIYLLIFSCQYFHLEQIGIMYKLIFITITLGTFLILNKKRVLA